MMRASCMITCFIAFLCFVFLSFPVFASVTGTVTDTSGNPVTGATVTFIDESNPDNRFSDDTDNQGNYVVGIIGITGVDESIPSAFSLGQNYPNPFNPTTTIPFNLGKSGNVRIDIYNITGQHIKTLVDGYYNTGSHNVVWDARDESGNHVSAGVYLCRLSSEGFVKANKMMLLDGGSGTASNGGSSALTQNGTATPSAKLFKKFATIWKVEIKGNEIETYTETNLVLLDDGIYNFVVSRLSGNSTNTYNGITFVSIPGGTFQMGDEIGDLWSGCRLVHTVTVSSFDMGVYEVTNAQYATYLNEALKLGDVTATSESVKGATDEYKGQEYLYLAGYYSDYPGNDCKIQYSNGTFSVKSGYENWPVAWVSWYGSKSFTLYYGLDLPTEAEWEYACRGGKQYKYGTNDGTISTSKVNYYDTGIKHPVDVGSYLPNPFGLYDMSGNVFEWCHDWYESYSSGSEVNPSGAQTGAYPYRVIRGGGWGYFDYFCRSASRSYYGPDDRDLDLGFRVVRRSSAQNY